MHALWDVFWTDTQAALTLVAPMLLLSLPASALGTSVGRNASSHSWRRLFGITLCGAVTGTLVTAALLMILQFFLRIEGLPLTRLGVVDRGTTPFILVSPVLSFLAAYAFARRAPAFGSQSRRRYTLQQLFLGQFVVCLILGWWVITRREEIGQRPVELDWQAREQAATATFGKYGWYVKTWRDNGHIALWNPNSSAPQFVTDDALDLVAQHAEVIELDAKSDAITDEGLKRLSAAKNLQTIVISSSQISDEGIHCLAKVSALKTLAIESPHITVSGLKNLPHSKSLALVIVRGMTLSRDEYFALCSARPEIGWAIEWKE